MEPNRPVHWDRTTDALISSTAGEEPTNLSPSINQLSSEDFDFELLLGDVVHSDFNFFNDELNRELELFPSPWNPDSRSSEELDASNLSTIGPAQNLSPLHNLDPSMKKVTVVATGPNGKATTRARFSRESVQILRKWLVLNKGNPYPDEEDKAMLQHQTGLNKTQISNWLANARRRSRIEPQNCTCSYMPKGTTEPIDIPNRPPTPALRSKGHVMSPLQRWVDSPPEDEPASASDIARAIESQRGGISDLKRPCDYASTDDTSNCSLHIVSSASSVGTSSGGSFASSHSHASGGSTSLRPMPPFHIHRRRRKRAIRKREANTSLITPLKPFQCTFCPETFKTKHDWQRHEKSLHLSLERWICAPEGPTAIDIKTGRVSCVYCSTVDPDVAHTESHNHSICVAKPVCEKTFYRKDNLNQHLKLIHGVKFLDWCMKSWKVTTSEVQSRCGFCQLIMVSWPMRIEHLAEHFRSGSSMADWKGDWGFDAATLNMVRNAIPPYLIEMERNSTFPIRANRGPNESPRNAYELISLELAYFVVNYEDDHSGLPSNEEMQVEACRIIFASEVLSSRNASTVCSWLRDLLMASEEISNQARFAPIRQGVENRLCILRINGKDNLFDQCPLEQELRDFVNAKMRLNLPITDEELQKECCCIIGRIENGTKTTSDVTANWLVGLITSSTSWLDRFRQRVHLLRIEDTTRTCSQPTDSGWINLATHKSNVSGKSLLKHISARGEIDSRASDAVLPGETHNIVGKLEECCNKVSAESSELLAAIEGQNGQRAHQTEENSSGLSATIAAMSREHRSDDLVSGTFTNTINDGSPTRRPRSFESMMKCTFFMNDTNCYRHLAQDLTRFVTSTMSPNNPNRHVPTDAEIQHQARWMMFDSDDPWNQTAADNHEWLQRFKRDVGILAPDVRH